MHGRGERGQASVELLAAVPLLLLFALVAWQAVVLVRSAGFATSSARVAARAVQVGADPLDAARGGLPADLARRVSVHRIAGGAVRVEVPVPAVLAGGTLTTVESTAVLPGAGR